MKKLLILLIALSATLVSSAQTAAQLEMLKQNPELLQQLNSGSATTPTGSIAPNKASFDQTRDANNLEPLAISMQKDSLPLKTNQRKVYGHNLFSHENLTFAPSMDMPTPENYILSSGDQLFINTWGASENEYNVTVSPDGYINLQNIGLISVKGLTIKAAQERIKSNMLEKMEGITDGAIKINMSLGNIRSIKINIAGEAKTPGTYTLPSLATLFNAIYVAGGVSEIGSVREIKLFRAGKLLSTLDVYDYLLKGDLEANIRLEDNDLIVIQPYHNLVNITGEVKRPMFYELKSNETLKSLIEFTGGFTGNAFSDNLTIDRSATGREKQIFSIDRQGFEYFPMMDLDNVTVGKIKQTYANKISISGPVWRAGNYELNEKSNTIKKLLEVAQGARENAFLGRAHLLRLNDDRTRESIALNISSILDGSASDFALMPDDSLHITAYEELFQPQTVEIKGEVNKPDTVQFNQGMTLLDAIMLGSGLKESASLARVEVARRVSSPDATTPSSIIAENYSFKISKDLSLTSSSENFVLMPFDIVTIRRSPGYHEQQPIFLDGEIVFTGEYVLDNNQTTISDIIAKAGGVTDEANVRGAHLRRQKTEADVERDRTINTIVTSDVFASNDTINVKQIKVGDYYTVGIDLEAALQNPKGIEDIILQKGDMLVVPTYINTVKVSGAVYFPNSITYNPKMRIKDYISQAGGYTKRSIRKPFIIYQNGMIATTKVTSKKVAIEPGSEIVIPQKPARDPMTAGQWVSVGSSMISMAAMITSLFN